MAANNILPVLIAGAGPTGLLLSLWLTHFGVPHRIVDPATSVGQTSRAIVVHARTLEFYEQLGLANKVISSGEIIDGLVIAYNGVIRPVLAFRDAGKGQSRFPFVLSLAQDQHEAVLEAELNSRGTKVERGIQVTSLEQHSTHTNVTLSSSSNSMPSSTIQVSYVAGCDGAHSAIRRLSSISMSGGTYSHPFFVADVEAESPLFANPNLNFCMSPSDFVVCIRLAGTGRARLVGSIPPSVGNSDQITYSDCEPTVARNMGPDFVVQKVHWFSHYKVRHRCASQFRSHRIFLLGDAAHVHSPVGGQGMNTGLGDATNLAWKLAQVYHSQRSSSLLAHTSEPRENQSDTTTPSSTANALLETYESDRLPFAHLLVSTTDTLFGFMTSDTCFSRFLRRIFAPYILPVLTRWLPIAPFMYKRTSQLGLEYRESEISEEVGRMRGRVRAGHRLPWVERIVLKGDERDEIDNFAVLKSITWQAHVYGDPPSWVGEVLAKYEIPLHVFEWNKRCGEVGLGRDELYLVRPDGYVGLLVGAYAKVKEGEEGLHRYVTKWGIEGK